MVRVRGFEAPVNIDRAGSVRTHPAGEAGTDAAHENRIGAWAEGLDPQIGGLAAQLVGPRMTLAQIGRLVVERSGLGDEFVERRDATMIGRISRRGAPRVGLEPTTLRLTAGCSAN
jgi:hypothetical protein